MNVKICYKDYELKLTLEAMKKFKQKTGKDLWFTILSVYEAWLLNTEDKHLLTMMKSLVSKCDFETACYAVHSMCVDNVVSFEEIQDALFRSGWRPVEGVDSDYLTPYPLLLAHISQQMDIEMAEVVKKNNKQSGKESPETT